jgi:hypothetical protein
VKFVCADEFATEGEEFYGDGHRVYELNEKPAQERVVLIILIILIFYFQLVEVVWLKRGTVR